MATGYDPEMEEQDDLDQNIQDQQDEVVVLESIFSETDRLRVISRPGNMEEDTLTSEVASKQQHKGFVIQIDVKVELDDEGLAVEAWFPCPDDNTQPTVAGAGASKPQFERTVSGRHWNTSFRLKYLTALTLEVVLPRCYPGSGPPHITLSCLWLNRDQLDELRKQLNVMWNESPGMPIIYTWVDWLQHNTLSTLGLEDTVSLIAENMEGDIEAGDTSTPSYSLERIIHEMLLYNYSLEFEAFRQNPQTCGICYDEKLGSEFFRLADCLHHFCADCLSSYSEFHVQEGTVRQLTCPEVKCTTILPANVLQAVLTEEAFDRWERLLFQNTLATMGDIEWCPRCNNPVIREKEDHLMLAHCTACIFSFCTRCKETWHQGRKCDIDEELVTTEDKDLVEVKHKKVQANVKKKRETYQSLAWIRSSTKPCPVCRVPILKNLGCNKIQCTNCLIYMCWDCGKCIKGHDHYGAMCPIWTAPNYIPEPGRPVPEGMRRAQQHLIDQRQEAYIRLKKCPKCKQNCLKQRRDNHIHCWCCHTHFCFLCGSVLQPPITSHYTHASPCVQHSD